MSLCSNQSDVRICPALVNAASHVAFDGVLMRLRADHILDLANGDVVVGNGRYASSMRAPNGQLPTDAEAAEDDEQDQDDDDRQDDKAVVVGGGGAMSYTVRSLSMAALGGRTTQEVHRALVSAYEERVIGKYRTIDGIRNVNAHLQIQVMGAPGSLLACT